MKFLVDQAPVSKDSCPFSKWVPYPPCIEEPGYYKCSIDNQTCYLIPRKSCNWVKAEEENK